MTYRQIYQGFLLFLLSLLLHSTFERTRLRTLYHTSVANVFQALLDSIYTLVTA